MHPCNLTNSHNLALPNIKYLWFLLVTAITNPLSEEKKTGNLTKREIFLKSTFIALFVIVPSLSSFFLAWIILNDLFQALIIGAIIHFIAMGFSLKISKKFIIKQD